MKSLLVIRHAKSSWSTADLLDFDRPLNERGKRDAPAVAEALLNKNVKIDTFISSPAKRAKKTAQYFCEAYSRDKDDIILKPELYHAAPDVFLDVIKHIGNKSNTVAIFSHNPGITDFVNTLTDTRIDDMPTCGVYAIQMQEDDWSKFENAEKTFWFFEAPKLL